MTKQDRIVTAALDAFGRYGYRRTSMDLIAQVAGVSRPAVYQHFKGKEDVFRAVGKSVVHRVLTETETASRSDGPVADRLYAVLSVKLELFAGTVDAESRAELFAEARGIADDIIASFEAGYAAVLEAVLANARDELDLLDKALPSRDAAAILVDALAGIMQSEQEPPVLRTRLRQLVDLTVRGLSTKPD
jgi:TetR/AcrR family transcriptional regulator